MSSILAVGSRFSVWSLPKGSYGVPFWVSSGVLVRDYNMQPKKELHRRVWVGCRV